MSRIPGQYYGNNWQQPDYVQPGYQQQGYVQPGFVQPGQQFHGQQQFYGQPQQQHGALGNMLHRNRSRSRSSSSSHGSPSRRADKARRRQMRQQGLYNNQMGYQQGFQPGLQQPGQGGFVQGLRNKVDNVIHGNRRFWNWLISILFTLQIISFYSF